MKYVINEKPIKINTGLEQFKEWYLYEKKHFGTPSFENTVKAINLFLEVENKRNENKN